jgi:hypothetical protein
VTRPDDSILDPQQLALVRRHADLLLREAAAIGRFPTPIDDLLEAAKLTLVDNEELDEGLLQQFLSKAKSGIATIKSALSKVLGMFDSSDRLVLIDRNAPKPRIPFIKLHEAGHGRLPHQCKMYKLVHDCEKTLDPYITDLFEREANVFASEEAHGQSFGMKVPMKLAKKYGASNYATFRRYVMTSPNACCLVVLEPSQYDDQGDFTAEVRRVVPSKLFETIYDEKVFGSTVNATHPLGAVVPRKRMCYPREVLLTDRNGDQRICRAEAFGTGHHTLVLLKDMGLRNHSGITVLAHVF